MRNGSLSLLVFLAMSLVVAQEMSVTTIGSGPSRRQALEECMRQAVEQVLGVYVRSDSFSRLSQSVRIASSGEVKDRVAAEMVDVFRDRVRTQASGFSRVVEVLAEEQQGSEVKVTARIAVSEPKIQQELRTVLLRRGDPRIAVLIPEFVIQRTVPDPAVETELIKALTDSGFRVVTPRITSGNSNEILRYLGMSGASEVLGDILVTGEAFAERVNPQPSELRNTGFVGYSARVEIKVLDVATGQVFFSQAYTSGGVGLADSVAAKASLQNTARKAVNELGLELTRFITGVSSKAARANSVRVIGLPDFSTAAAIVEDIRDLSGVIAAISRNYSSGSLDVEVQYDGAAEDLAASLEQLGLEVVEFGGGRLVVRFKGTR